MPKISRYTAYVVPEPSFVSGSRPYEGDDAEYRATVSLNHGTSPTREHLQALVDAALAELVGATDWSASLDTRAGSRVEFVALFRAPDRRAARDRQRAALHAAQQVNGKVSKNDRCGKPEFVRNFRPPAS